MKAARNSAIGCGILLAVIEGVGIGIQRMMAENTRLDVRLSPFLQTPCHTCNDARHFLKHGRYLSILPCFSNSFKHQKYIFNPWTGRTFFIFLVPKPTSSSSHNSAPSTSPSSSSASSYTNHLFSSPIVTSASAPLTSLILITRLQLTNARMMNPSTYFRIRAQRYTPLSQAYGALFYSHGVGILRVCSTCTT